MEKHVNLDAANTTLRESPFWMQRRPIFEVLMSTRTEKPSTSEIERVFGLGSEPALQKLLTTKEAAELLRVVPKTLDAWNNAGLLNYTFGNPLDNIADSETGSWLATSMDSIRMKQTKEKNQQKTVKIGDRVTLKQRGKSGIWQMEFHYKGHRHKTTNTAKLKIARKKAILLEAQLIEGTYEVRKKSEGSVTAVNCTIDHAINRFISHHETEGSRRKTYIRYQGILRNFRDFLNGKSVTLIEEIDVRVVDQYREFRKPTVGQTTMYKDGTTIKRFLNWCVDRKFITENPLKNRVFKKPRTKVNKVLTLDMVNVILRKATKIRFPIFAMLAFTGMRISELRNLLVEDVDFDSNMIYIRSREGFENKTGENWQVPIHPRLRKILLELHVNTVGWFFTALSSKKYPDGDHHINPKRINEDFIAVLEKLDIPSGRADGGFTIHSLRHFFKTFCITNGVAKPVVDEWQGHELRSSASDQYFHLTDADSQRLMKRVPFGTDE